MRIHRFAQGYRRHCPKSDSEMHQPVYVPSVSTQMIMMVLQSKSSPAMAVPTFIVFEVNDRRGHYVYLCKSHEANGAWSVGKFVGADPLWASPASTNNVNFSIRSIVTDILSPCCDLCFCFLLWSLSFFHALFSCCVVWSSPR